MKKYLSEFVGTLFLTLVVITSVKSNFFIETPVLAALTLGLMVYVFGKISGGHFNPAITLAEFSQKRIGLEETNYYVVSQFLGALGAWGLSLLFAIHTLVNVELSWTAFGSELVGALVFALGVASIKAHDLSANISGALVSISLLIGISFSMLLGGAGVINPAVALGLGTYNFAYLLGPVAGAMLGMKLLSYIRS